MSIKIPVYKFKLKAPEFQMNDEEFEVWFLEGVLELNPNYIECLMYLGNAYTAMGLFQEGLDIDLRLIKLMPYDSLVHYNLACSYSLLEEINKALSSLQLSIEFGYNDIFHIENDSDLDNLRNSKGYRKLIKKLKESTKKYV